MSKRRDTRVPAPRADRGEEEYRRIARELRAALEKGKPPEAALDRLLAVTHARATGLWRLDGDFLRLVCFGSAGDMPRSVHDGFAAATEEVSLESTDLGIVKAAVTRQPSPATIENPSGKLGGSATWLERFGAEQSLAVPVDEGPARVLGVLALSAPYRFGEASFTWQLLLRLAESLAEPMGPGRGSAS